MCLEILITEVTVSQNENVFSDRKSQSNLDTQQQKKQI